MDFATVAFMFGFLPVVVLLYHLLPPIAKNAVLLISGLVFLCWGGLSALFPAAGVWLVCWLCGLLASNGRRRVLPVALAAVCCGGIFVGFATLPALAAQWGFSLPYQGGITLGLPFYTLMGIDYVRATATKRAPTLRNPVTLGAYLLFFPLMAAGPAATYAAFSKTLQHPQNRTDLAGMSTGIAWFIAGLAGKLLVADSLLGLWSGVLGNPQVGRTGIGLAQVSTPLAWLTLLAFALWFYSCFASYVRMARGLALMLGFSVEPGFVPPLGAHRFTDIFTGFNRSVTTWFFRNIYEPLAGSGALLRRLSALVAALLALAIWYGPRPGWLVWAALCGVVLVLEATVLAPLLQKQRLWQTFYAPLLFLLCLIPVVATIDGAPALLLLYKLFVPQGGAGAWFFLRGHIPALLGGFLIASPLPYKIGQRLHRYPLAELVACAALLLVAVAFLVAGTRVPALTSLWY